MHEASSTTLLHEPTSAVVVAVVVVVIVVTVVFVVMVVVVVAVVFVVMVVVVVAVVFVVMVVVVVTVVFVVIVVVVVAVVFVVMVVVVVASSSSSSEKDAATPQTPHVTRHVLLKVGMAQSVVLRFGSLPNVQSNTGSRFLVALQNWSQGTYSDTTWRLSPEHDVRWHALLTTAWGPVKSDTPSAPTRHTCLGPSSEHGHGVVWEATGCETAMATAASTAATAPKDMALVRAIVQLRARQTDDSPLQAAASERAQKKQGG